jgi:murein DD-endopeptidase MepM/ murein hydrolase activator NlpD
VRIGAGWSFAAGRIGRHAVAAVLLVLPCATPMAQVAASPAPGLGMLASGSAEPGQAAVRLLSPGWPALRDAGSGRAALGRAGSGWAALGQMALGLGQAALGPASSDAPRYRWPLAGTPRVVAAFDPPAQPWLPGQRGVDLATTPGATVFAAGAGTVTFAGPVAGIGVVTIAHSGGLRTTYEPLRVTVRKGDRIAAGAPIGHITGAVVSCPAAVGACLHWGLLRGQDYLDPLALLGLGRVRLFPTEATPPAQRIDARTRGSPAASRSYSSAWLYT